MNADYDTIKVTRGAMPGGGYIRVHRMSEDTFGVLANHHLRNLRAELKKDRRKAVNAIERLMRTYELLGKDDTVLCVSLGADKLGNVEIAVVSEWREEGMM